MDRQITIYHGSKQIVEVPTFGIDRKNYVLYKTRDDDANQTCPDILEEESDGLYIPDITKFVDIADEKVRDTGGNALNIRLICLVCEGKAYCIFFATQLVKRTKIAGNRTTIFTVICCPPFFSN